MATKKNNFIIDFIIIALIGFAGWLVPSPYAGIYGMATFILGWWIGSEWAINTFIDALKNAREALHEEYKNHKKGN